MNTKIIKILEKSHGSSKEGAIVKVIKRNTKEVSRAEWAVVIRQLTDAVV